MSESEEVQFTSQNISDIETLFKRAKNMQAILFAKQTAITEKYNSLQPTSGGNKKARKTPRKNSKNNKSKKNINPIQ